MIVLKLPADASDHPYMLSEVIALAGSKVSKGDPLFKLVRAGTKCQITFRAPIDGRIGSYLVGGTDLLSAPGQHIVTMEKNQTVPTSDTADTVAARTPANAVEIYLPDDPSLYPVRIEEWLVSVGDTVVLEQPLAQVILGDGRSWVFNANATGRVTLLAANKGSYITRMARLACTLAQDDPQAGPAPKAAKPQTVPNDASEGSYAAPPPKQHDPVDVLAPVEAEYYPQSVMAWHVKVGDHVATDQAFALFRRASGDMWWARSPHTGRVLSRNVVIGSPFAISDVIIVVDQADPPPTGWQMPTDPATPSDRILRASKKSAHAALVQMEHAAARQEEASARQNAQKSSPDQQGDPVAAFLVFLGMAAMVGIGLLYVFTGSRIIFGAALVAVLLPVLVFATGTRRISVASVLVLASALLMIAPQDRILPPMVTAWEPFGIGAPSPDGARLGGFWENLNRPRPTQQQQKTFDAWLEG